MKDWSKAVWSSECTQAMRFDCGGISRWQMYVCALWIWICESTCQYNVCTYRHINITWSDVKYEKFKLNKKEKYESERKENKYVWLGNCYIFLTLYYCYNFIIITDYLHPSMNFSPLWRHRAHKEVISTTPVANDEVTHTHVPRTSLEKNLQENQ